jgi:hypothetical protein
MAATKTRSQGSNGLAVKAKSAGGTVASTARRAAVPALAAGSAAAGLAGGLVIGSRVGTRRRRGRLGTMLKLAGAAGRVAKAARRASSTADDIRAIREYLETVNRRSPIEVVLDGLTHRPGARGS